MVSNRYLRAKLNDVRSQMLDLRDQIQALSAETIKPMAGDWVDRTQTGALQVRELIADQAHTASAHVGERPLATIVLAAAVGWVAGRFGP